MLEQEVSGRAALEALQRFADEHERYRLSDGINLISAHNRMSPATRSMLSSSFAEKFTSGAIGSRAHSGGRWIDEMEALVIALAQRLFRPFEVEMRPMSGTLANQVALAAIVRRGETIVAPSRIFGGHVSLRAEGFAGFLGLTVLDLPFSSDGLSVDLEALEVLATRNRPKAIVVGTSKMLFPYTLDAIIRIASSVGATVFYDAAHVLGLIAGGQFQDPLSEGADIVTGSTQKTIPGPIGGLVVTSKPAISQSVKNVASVMFDNYQTNRIASLGVVLAEMLEFGHEFARATVIRAQWLGEDLSEQGLQVLGERRGFTQCHQVLVNVTALNGSLAAGSLLEDCTIFCSTVKLWSLDGVPQEGLRFGATDIARLGFDRDGVRRLAHCIADALLKRAPSDQVRAQVVDLAQAFRTLNYTLT